MLSLFKKFKDGLSKSAKSIAEKTGGIFRRHNLDASTIEELEEALYAADFGYETAEEIVEETRKAYKKDKNLSRGDRRRRFAACSRGFRGGYSIQGRRADCHLFDRG